MDRVAAFWRKEHGVTVSRKPFCTWNGTDEAINGLAGDPDGEFVTWICPTPWHSLSVAWDGTVVPCCYDYDCLYPLGDAKKMTLAEIWNSGQMRAFRAEMRSSAITNPLCRACRRVYHKHDLSRKGKERP